MKKNGFVYFIEAIGQGAVKIGWAINVKKRLAHHQIGCPIELRIMTVAPATLGHEGALQSKFSHLCIRGEWYRFEGELRHLINEIVETGLLPEWVKPPIRRAVENRVGIASLMECVEILGTQSALAKKIGVTPATVSNVIQQNNRVPAHWCLAVEDAVERRVTRHQLRPDLYPVGLT